MRTTVRSLVAATVAATSLVGAAARPSSAALDTTSDDQADYQVRIVRDGAGVPHIIGADLGSVAYGQGMMIAEDRGCTVVDQIIKVRGQRAAHFGPGTDEQFVDSDFAYLHLGLWADAPERWAHQPDDVAAIVRGAVAGFNAVIAANDGLACPGFDWSGPISEQDYYAVVSDVLLLASSQNLIDEIGSSQPPAPEGAGEGGDGGPSGLARLRPHDDIGSNGWAFGSERSTTGGGLLLGNPHFPWEGELRFWENHLIVPGELNIYGVSLSGLPGIQIGFNEHVAWTHTVSSGHRFNLYRYDLDPSDPTMYLVDGEPQPMEATEYSIEVLGDDGALSGVTRTLYRTKHGPVVAIDPLGWSTTMAFAIADANIEIDRVVQQFLGMDRATSLEEFQQVHAEIQGVPWVNTMASSADGRAWFTDGSATPHLSDEALAAWQAERDAGGLAGLAYDFAGIIMLNGSDSLFDWVDDPTAPAAGLLPAADQPQLERADFVFNANDSYRWTNPAEPLTGFTILQGNEDETPTPRTRTNLQLLTETDAAWTIHDLQQALFSDRTVLSEQLLAPLVAACTATPNVTMDDGTAVDVTAACTALAGWDGTFTRDARGAIVFREWLSRVDMAELNDEGRLWSDAFDPADPAHTPAVPSSDTDEWLRRLAVVQMFLQFLGIPLDAPLGDYQFEVRTGTRIPIHGGNNSDGVANVMSLSFRNTSTLPHGDVGTYVDAASQLRQFADGSLGYPIEYGASFVYTVQYGPDGPQAEGILSYGNPDDPQDPAYRLGLDGLSNGEWRPFTFDPDAVEALFADPALAQTIVGE